VTDLLQGGNGAVTRLLTDQEQSWANPSHQPAGEPVLVGTIYFGTKERSTDAQDEAVLSLLGKAYAQCRRSGEPDAARVGALDSGVVAQPRPRSPGRCRRGFRSSRRPPTCNSCGIRTASTSSGSSRGRTRPV
jgi:hypothetical protein